MMSKLRQDIPIPEGDLDTPAEGDLRAYVCFTQLKPGGPYIYAGWLDASDDVMALQFAREHYGRDQKCTAVWAVARGAIAGTEAEFAPADAPGATRTWQVFAQDASGDPHVSQGSVEAASGAEALKKACAGTDADSTWVVCTDDIIATGADDLVWRLTDQSYRMARGYSSEVREKWEKIRSQPDLAEYERDDLKEAF